MSRVINLERNMGNGATEPKLGQIDTNEGAFNAVIKTKDNPGGIKSIINEFICYHLAKSLNLLMPYSGVATIDSECNCANEDIVLNESDYGSCFFSRYIKAALINSAILPAAKNTEIFEEIIVFDHIIYNSDRNDGNILLSTSKGDKFVYAIDHSHVFKNGTIWDKNCLRIGIFEDDYLDTKIMEYNEYIYGLFFGYKSINRESLLNVASRFKSIISLELLNGIFSKIPDDWEADKDELHALSEYIIYRVSHLEEMCDMIIGCRNGGEIL